MLRFSSGRRHSFRRGRCVVGWASSEVVVVGGTSGVVSCVGVSALLGRRLAESGCAPAG